MYIHIQQQVFAKTVLLRIISRVRVITLSNTLDGNPTPRWRVVVFLSEREAGERCCLLGILSLAIDERSSSSISGEEEERNTFWVACIQTYKIDTRGPTPVVQEVHIIYFNI